MKIKEFTQKINELIAKHNINQEIADEYAEYSYYGLRFENKERETGEICGNSRHNFDREDQREFPEYGDDDYQEMMELGGTSAYYIGERGEFDTSSYTGEWQSEDDSLMVTGDHCYLVAGDVEGAHPDPDVNEILISEAVVIEKLF